MKSMNHIDGLITTLGSKSPITEAYRTLRTNLEFLSPDESLKTFLFTSTGPGEGKSTTAANIAICMAQKNKKVLLIDCDLRKPVQHKIFALSNVRGLTNYLVEHELSIEDVIQKSAVEQLDILTSGFIPPIPTELLGSQKMKLMVEELMKKYDLVIFDTPPIISVTDAAVLSSIVNGVILVVSIGQAEKNMVKRACSLLAKVNARILGVVVNREKVQKAYEYYYYYQSKGEKNAL